MRRLGAAICIVLPLLAAAAIVAAELWRGPVVLSLSADHGIDTGDLIALPLVVIAIAVARGRSAWRVRSNDGPPAWAVPASAILLGGLLLAGVVAKSGGGSLVPAGGGTLDSVIRSTSATSPLPVDVWSDVALTYDGAVLRLYVNGSEVSSHATNGMIQSPGDPLWIGGNRPYGEHFDGLIDEVRVYDRALRASEIRDDMATRVAPATGLVSAYAFDAGSGTTAADSSGERNSGAIEGATWARGRYGDALRFDGKTSVVRVSPSASLDLGKQMTLSGWVRPAARQAGWRTIVQRQTDAYFLTAGSDRQVAYGGPLDDVRAALLAAAALCFCILLATAPGASAAARRRAWWLPVPLFVVGSLADALLKPAGTLIGPALVGLALAAMATKRAEAATFLLGAAVFAGMTLASLAGIAGVEEALSRDDGAIARTAALGALFVGGGLAAGLGRRRSAPVPVTPPSPSLPGSAAGPH
jgi:hypothetical protein